MKYKTYRYIQKVVKTIKPIPNLFIQFNKTTSYIYIYITS